METNTFFEFANDFIPCFLCAKAKKVKTEHKIGWGGIKKRLHRTIRKSLIEAKNVILQATKRMWKLPLSFGFCRAFLLFQTFPTLYCVSSLEEKKFVPLVLDIPS